MTHQKGVTDDHNDIRNYCDHKMIMKKIVPSKDMSHNFKLMISYFCKKNSFNHYSILPSKYLVSFF